VKRKTQRRIAIIITVLVSISMIGFTGIGIFQSSLLPPSSNQPAATTPSVLDQYNLQKNTVQTLEAKAKANPQDMTTRQDLANAYFDLAVLAQEAAPEESVTDFAKAVDAYQTVLDAMKTAKDINILVDMATAAFYAGQDDLAEKSFKEALAQQPKSFNALYNYGMFLAQAKKDNVGAIKVWQEALAADPANPRAADLQALIQQAQATTPSP